MSCAILAYLHQTQEIFTHYRLIWSVIIAAIGANMSAGQSGVSYFLRILGSFAALIICYAVWYIPDGKVPYVSHSSIWSNKANLKQWCYRHHVVCSLPSDVLSAQMATVHHWMACRIHY